MGRSLPSQLVPLTCRQSQADGSAAAGSTVSGVVTVRVELTGWWTGRKARIPGAMIKSVATSCISLNTHPNRSVATVQRSTVNQEREGYLLSHEMQDRSHSHTIYLAL